MADDWQPIETMPDGEGSRIRVLIESVVEMEPWSPATLSGGWRRVSSRDKIVAWQPDLPPHQEP